MENTFFYPLLITLITGLYTWLLMSQKRRARRSIENIAKSTRERIHLNNTKLNFNNDIEFLMFVIEFKMSNAKKMILEPLQITHERAVINEKILDEQAEMLTVEIVEMLNEDYKAILYKYFTPQSLNEFITEAVFTGVAGTIIQLNGNKIRKFFNGFGTKEDIE